MVNRFVVVVALLAASAARGQDRLLCDFEDAAALKTWEVVSGQARLVEQGATHGRRAMEITFDPKGEYHGAYLTTGRLPGDWSAHDALVLDVLNPAGRPVPATLLVADRAWQDKGRSYWNRHNASAVFAPGKSEWVIPVRGLYRGEAGSRNNDIKRNIDPDTIVRVDFGFGEKGAAGRIVIDNLRLVKAATPAGVWALDFGPDSQSVSLGWTGASNRTAYTRQRGFGWGPRGGAPWDGAARDTTFGPALISDFCEAGGYDFRIDAPPGRYRVTVFFENSGYWGGEQAQHRTRRILVGGKEAWSETRPDGPAHALYRFEDVEPVGVDIWDTYMKGELARPAVFDAEAGKDGLLLRFEADRTWGCKVAAVAVHRAGDEAGEKWLAGQLDRLAADFRAKAVCLDKPAPAYPAPAAPKAAGLIAWPVRIEDTVTPNSLPASPPPAAIKVSRLAVRGEYEPFCIALRPLRNLGKCGLDLEPFTLKAPDGTKAALPAEVRVVRYSTSRDFNSIAYRIQPHTLRPAEAVDLPKDLTRQIIVTAQVPEGTAPGEYRGALLVKDPDGETLVRAELSLDVRPVTLERQTGFSMGFFGLMPPDPIPADRRWDVLDQTLTMLREHGMNALSDGPNFRLTGWKDGQPVIDFGEMDRFFALLARHGFTRPVNAYGGPRFLGLHDGYQKGPTGEAVERQSGLPYEQALMRAWAAVDAHARAAGWPTILYAMCDETRVRDVAERELAFMKLMAKVSAAYPKTLRTSGSYSVDFRSRPADPADLLHWHQLFFNALDISSLNGHDESVMAEARRLGKEIHIYNQGRDRYSFGLYQWSEHRKGVAARWQWHLNILHGYQFFDLDGREPDTAMICYGRKDLYPTVHFERCREGAEDFRLYQTLWNRLQAPSPPLSQGPALKRAGDLLEAMTAKVRLNQRTPPPGFDADAFKRQIVSALEALGG